MMKLQGRRSREGRWKLRQLVMKKGKVTNFMIVCSSSLCQSSMLLKSWRIYSGGSTVRGEILCCTTCLTYLPWRQEKCRKQSKLVLVVVCLLATKKQTRATTTAFDKETIKETNYSYFKSPPNEILSWWFIRSVATKICSFSVSNLPKKRLSKIIHHNTKSS